MKWKLFLVLVNVMTVPQDFSDKKSCLEEIKIYSNAYAANFWSGVCVDDYGNTETIESDLARMNP